MFGSNLQFGLPQAAYKNSVIFKKPQVPMQAQLPGNPGQLPGMARPPFVQQPQPPAVPSLIDMAKQMPETPMMDQVDENTAKEMEKAVPQDDNSTLIAMLMGGGALAGLLGGKGGGKEQPVEQAPAVMPAGNPRLQPVNFGRQTGLMQRSRPFAGYFGG